MIPSEGEIQNYLFRDLLGKGHTTLVPNVHLFSWESDLISMTKAGYVWEYEIKRTRSDYQRDKSKDRHRRLEAWSKRAKLGHTQPKGKKGESVPRHFFYVVPRGLITAAELPSYAGLIVFDEDPGGRLWFETIVKPPALAKNSASVDQTDRLTRSLMYRFWCNRLGVAQI